MQFDMSEIEPYIIFKPIGQIEIKKSADKNMRAKIRQFVKDFNKKYPRNGIKII